MVTTIVSYADNFVGDGPVLYRKCFVDIVNTYHHSHKRPIECISDSCNSNTNTYNPDENPDEDIENDKKQEQVQEVIASDPRVVTYAGIERETCLECNGKRQLYCGSCGGLRLAKAIDILPPRVEFPFDILLLLHW